MSRVTELADQEAALAEAEPALAPDELEAVRAEAEPEPEPAPSPEPNGPEDEPRAPSMEKQFAAFEKENIRHEKELRKVMGDDFEAFEPCAACDAIGFRVVVAMPFDSTAEQCGVCKGHGYLLTGAVREDRVVRECVHCQGNGFREKPPEYAPQAPAEPPRPRFDPYTGLPIAEGAEAGNGSPAAGWAPGYTPPGTSVPVATVGA